jgi:hypothetical protein
LLCGGQFGFIEPGTPLLRFADTASQTLHQQLDANSFR